MTETPALVFANVTRTYQQGDERIHALRDVSLLVKRGEFVAVAGPSGSGKTTLLNVAGGLDRPDSGEVIVGGRDLAGLSRKEMAQLRLDSVAYIFQAHNLVPVLSAEENAEFILLLRGMPAEERRVRVRGLLEQVGLGGMEKRRPAQLSGGQQQRVAVARAIAARPVLVLADEPTSNLDTKTASALMDIMEELNRKQRTTFVFSTHDPRIMERARRVIRLLDGGVETDELQSPDQG